MPEVKRIHAVYRKSDSFRVVPVSGTWGSIAPDGNIIAHLFYESPSLPEESLRSVDGDAIGPEETSTNQEQREYERRVELAIVLAPERAETIANWLLERVKERRALDRGEA